MEIRHHRGSIQGDSQPPAVSRMRLERCFNFTMLLHALHRRLAVALLAVALGDLFCLKTWLGPTSYFLMKPR